MKGNHKKYGTKFIVCHPDIAQEVRKRTQLPIVLSYGMKVGEVFLCREKEKEENHEYPQDH